MNGCCANLFDRAVTWDWTVRTTWGDAEIEKRGSGLPEPRGDH